MDNDGPFIYTTLMAGSRNIKLTIAYQGTRYCGWQRQKGDVTVQETIEEAVSKLLGRRTKVQGASRTDSGVHADGPLAKFYGEDAPTPTEAVAWILTGRLPPDIGIRDSVEVPAGFHASGDAINKTYLYRIYVGREKDVHLHNFRWHVTHPLNLKAMNEAAALLVGTHDFWGFTSAKDTRENAVRTVMESRAWWHPEAPELIYMIKANRFLYHMVRNIVGTLVEIARGYWPPEKVAQILAGRDRTAAGPTAPAHGLCLHRVEYLKNSTSLLDMRGGIGNTLSQKADDAE